MPAILETRGLSKTYRKGSVLIPVLRDVSLEVCQGEFLAIVGRSGSGKSTLLNLVGGLDTPTGGSVYVRGVDIASQGKAGLARHRRGTVGFVFQSFNLIPSRTALENVSLALAFGEHPASDRARRAEEVLRSVGLGHRLGHRPGEMSGGEAQRVAVARALANAPDVLLADEPTGNLDSATSGEIAELLRGLNDDRGLTVLMVTHEEPLAAHVAHRIVKLHDGRLAPQERIAGRSDPKDRREAS
ncbi:MAG: ATP-binding cassette domain-containing protein [Candidatus Eisenbacteria bacterium]|nr:ATP-binding cassette domain-containing protein [Candidatus Eisenbacteria bacterium]